MHLNIVIAKFYYEHCTSRYSVVYYFIAFSCIGLGCDSKNDITLTSLDFNDLGYNDCESETGLNICT